MKFLTFLLSAIAAVSLASCSAKQPTQVAPNSPVYVKSAHDLEVESRQKAIVGLRLRVAFDDPNVEVSAIGTNSDILWVSGKTVTNDFAHKFQRTQSMQELKQLGFVSMKFSGPTQTWEFPL